MPELMSTRYPVLLVHGIGYRDNISIIKYWGRIPGYLRRHGVVVYCSHNDSWGTCESNAKVLFRQITSLLKETGSERLNVIAHSKGGLDIRYLITVLKKAECIASLTTLSSPHRGSSLADFVLQRFSVPEKIYASVINMLARILGDYTPDSRHVLSELTTSYMKQFNNEVPDNDDVFYQSYSFFMKKPSESLLFCIPYRILYRKEGPNDGLVSVASSKWGQKNTVIEGFNREKGISHLEIIDFKRKKISGIDIPGLYGTIVQELKKKGF